MKRHVPFYFLCFGMFAQVALRAEHPHNSSIILENIISQERVLELALHNFMNRFPHFTQDLYMTRADGRKIKLLIARCVNTYGRKYAGNFLRDIARDIGLKSEEEINLFVRDCKELIKAALPDKVFLWAQENIFMQRS